MYFYTLLVFMISILIPTYNYSAVPLVKELYNQSTKCKIVFEILVYDDESHSSINTENQSLNLLKHCVFKELQKNIGRSAIRNLLMKDAKFENLIFLDSDVIPLKKTFIKDYVCSIEDEENVIVGGITYDKNIPQKPFKLRWLYTKKREINKGIHSSNFFIKKYLMDLNPFDETITKYGCEDVLFFNSLKKQKIKIKFIDNPVIHLGNDDANSFLRKTEQAIENLLTLIEENKIDKNLYNITKVNDALRKLKLEKFVAFLYKRSKPLLFKNFNSNYPSIILYDFYRLSYFCYINLKK